ncbi:hypothetical protein [Streptomyces sp. NPDC052811]|uniref:hypothetical protein n=1 Tax=Streptomyces sp. NPDC052811 TaxID=3155731 RepID=UPI00344621D5
MKTERTEAGSTFGRFRFRLRDTDGRCLCTKFSGLGAGKNSTFFAQFPAPPANTTEVDFQVPHM